MTTTDAPIACDDIRSYLADILSEFASGHRFLRTDPTDEQAAAEPHLMTWERDGAVLAVNEWQGTADQVRRFRVQITVLEPDDDPPVASVATP